MPPEEEHVSAAKASSRADHLPRILTFADTYVPGYRGGGPVQSIKNLVDALGGEFAFSVVTRDRDLGQRTPYPEIRAGTWQRMGQADVCYLPPRGRCSSVFRLLRSKPHEVLYLNSALSSCFTLLPLALRRIRLVRDQHRVIVAPRGEFSPGALAIHPVKKAMFLWVARVIRLYQGVTWQATSAREADDIKRVIGAGSAAWGGRVAIAAGVPGWPEAAPVSRPKAAGVARIIFLARISRMKNLQGAIEFLNGVEGDIAFDICGPLEDSTYWGDCQAALEALPPNISPSYLGEIPHAGVNVLLSQYHLLLLPTLGENFGHVIAEALSAGCPVAISDRTPWRGLSAARAGWDLPLDDASDWRAAISRLVRADQEEFDDMSRSAAKYATGMFNHKRVVGENREMLRAGLAGSALDGLDS